MRYMFLKYFFLRSLLFFYLLTYLLMHVCLSFCGKACVHVWVWSLRALGRHEHHLQIVVLNLSVPRQLTFIPVFPIWLSRPTSLLWQFIAEAWASVVVCILRICSWKNEYMLSRFSTLSYTATLFTPLIILSKLSPNDAGWPWTHSVAQPSLVLVIFWHQCAKKLTRHDHLL